VPAGHHDQGPQRRLRLQCVPSGHAQYSWRAHACWQNVVSERVTLFVTPYILAEIRRLPLPAKLRKFGGFTPERVERFIEEVLEVAELIPDPPPKFSYPRDPGDCHYVDVAVATNSMLIVSNDKDLLDLMSDANDEGRALRLQHPGFKVFNPPQFLAEIA
jgi:putative PIN family toxin of toxin-antitoxin system